MSTVSASSEPASAEAAGREVTAATPGGADVLGGPGEAPGRAMSLPVGLLRLARPKQWAKNVLVFA
ncbi:MAG TPA: hypothetical protein VF015_11730, partial [Acidimicrobiales bacterium]